MSADNSTPSDLSVTSPEHRRPASDGSKPFVSLTRWQSTQKRAFDLVMSLVMITFCAPVLCAAALAVRLEGGPVFIRQRRLTYDGRQFFIYKFRTMRTDAETFPISQQALASDPRLTALGLLLRTTSLDELPQIFNVLKGDMSFVGPRPRSAIYNDKYEQISDTTLRVQPGLTGLSQIAGLGGDAQTLESLRIRYKYDKRYVRKWSICLDLKIIFRTLKLAFRNNAAY